VSVWVPSSSAIESAWVPSSESVWTPSSSTVESAWAPSPTEAKGNISISTSYTNTVYVTKATTATTTVDCGKGTMIYGNGSAPAFTPSLGLPSNMPTDLPSDWSKSIPSSVLSSVLPPQLSATGGIVTTNCANASVTYTFTYTPSGSKPKKTSRLLDLTTPTLPAPAPPSLSLHLASLLVMTWGLLAQDRRSPLSAPFSRFVSWLSLLACYKHIELAF
jgi:hypothetical protein